LELLLFGRKSHQIFQFNLLLLKVYLAYPGHPQFAALSLAIIWEWHPRMKYVAILSVFSKVPTLLWAALLLRLCWAFMVPVEPESDGAIYRLFAQSSAFGAGYAYPSGDLAVFWPVGASAFYILVFSLFGLSDAPVVIANVLLGMGVVCVLWVVFSRRTAMLNPLLAVSGFFLMLVVTAGQDRYHLPLIPFGAIFAASGLQAAQQYWLTRRTR
jgi:hypothetical protein